MINDPDVLSEFGRFERGFSWLDRHLRPSFVLSELIDIQDYTIEFRDQKIDRTDPEAEQQIQALSEHIAKMRVQISKTRRWLATLSMIKWALTVVGAPSFLIIVSQCI